MLILSGGDGVRLFAECTKIAHNVAKIVILLINLTQCLLSLGDWINLGLDFVWNQNRIIFQSTFSIQICRPNRRDEID